MPVTTNPEKVSRIGYSGQWENAVKFLLAKEFRGLKVLCPICGKNGMLFSKWISGTYVKPLYVFHRNTKAYYRCEVEKGEAPQLRKEIRFSRDDIIKAIRLGDPYILFSGGKDSLSLLHYINLLAKGVKKQVVAVHANTTAGFPEVETYVQSVCKQLNIPLVVVQPKRDFFDLAKRWGIPGVRSRWCCKTLKVAPIRRYLSTVKGQPIVFDGIRAAESHVRGTYLPIWYHPSFRCISVSPLFFWSNRRIHQYIAAHSLPLSPVSNLNTSAECWCGAYKAREDFEALLDIHPEIFDQLVEVENAQKGKFTFLYENGKHVPLSSLRFSESTDNEIQGDCAEP